MSIVEPRDPDELQASDWAWLVKVVMMMEGRQRSGAILRLHPSEIYNNEQTRALLKEAVCRRVSEILDSAEFIDDAKSV